MAATHLHGLPEPFVEAYGRVWSMLPPGSRYEFPMDQADQMTAVLLDLGFEVRLAP